MSVNVPPAALSECCLLLLILAFKCLILWNVPSRGKTPQMSASRTLYKAHISVLKGLDGNICRVRVTVAFICLIDEVMV